MDLSNVKNVRAENNLLGAIINNNNLICEVIDVLDYQDFYNVENGLIYKALADMYSNSKVINITTLVESLGPTLKEIGGITYIAQLVSSVVAENSSTVRSYAQIIKEKFNTRKLLNTLNQTITKVQQGNEKIDNVVPALQEELYSIKNTVDIDDGDVTKTLTGTIESIEKAYASGGDITGIKTHFTLLDMTLNGLNKQDLVIVAARPAMGKTAFSLNVMKNIAFRSNSKVALFNLEMGKEQMMKRLLSCLANIEMESIKKGKLDNKGWTELMKASSFIDSKRDYLRIYDKIFTLNGIVAECKKRKLQGGLDVVIIDYLTLIDGSGKIENRTQEVSKISRQLKMLAKELDITVIALAQLSRATEQRKDHRPMLSDLRESGSIEQDADVVIGLYRDEYYDPETIDKNIIESIILKNRNGEIGTIKMLWIPKYQKIGERSIIDAGTYDPKIFQE